MDPVIEPQLSHDVARVAQENGPAAWSMWDVLWRADAVVFCVAGLLIAASVWCWTIIIAKYLRLRLINRRSNAFEDAFWSGGSLEQLYNRVSKTEDDPMINVFTAAMREWRRSVSRGGSLPSEMRVSLQHRIERVMHVAIAREVDKNERFLGFLASTGSTAPFIGLFGTVWGIMQSFQAIAASQNTSLAVVAPGIAEALFVTALGLAAAIPAVLAYNKLSSDLGRYHGRLEAFATEFEAIISRQLEDA